MTLKNGVCCVSLSSGPPAQTPRKGPEPGGGMSQGITHGSRGSHGTSTKRTRYQRPVLRETWGDPPGKKQGAKLPPATKHVLLEIGVRDSGGGLRGSSAASTASFRRVSSAQIAVEPSLHFLGALGDIRRKVRFDRRLIRRKVLRLKVRFKLASRVRREPTVSTRSGLGSILSDAAAAASAAFTSCPALAAFLAMLCRDRVASYLYPTMKVACSASVPLILGTGKVTWKPCPLPSSTGTTICESFTCAIGLPFEIGDC